MTEIDHLEHQWPVQQFELPEGSAERLLVRALNHYGFNRKKYWTPMEEDFRNEELIVALQTRSKQIGALASEAGTYDGPPGSYDIVHAERANLELFCARKSVLPGNAYEFNSRLLGQGFMLEPMHYTRAQAVTHRFAVFPRGWDILPAFDDPANGAGSSHAEIFDEEGNKQYNVFWRQDFGYSTSRNRLSLPLDMA